jgi:glycosyltransferase involved in cell wall biosynthesis
MQKTMDGLAESTGVSAQPPTAQPPIRLMFITDSGVMGGDTRCEVWLLKTIDKQRFAITAFTSQQGTTPEQIGRIADIRHISARFGVLEPAPEQRRLGHKLGSALSFLGALAKVAWVARRTKPQIIFTGDRSRSMLAARVATRLSSAWLVFHPQFFFTPSFHNARLKRQTALKANLVITNSGYTTQTYARLGVPLEKLLLAYNGIDADAFSPGDGSKARAQFGIAEDALVLGIFSILSPFKGQAILLRAMPGILEAVPNAHLLIVGGGEIRAELEELAASLHLEQHVTFAGFQQETLPLYRAIDLYVMASIEEPFGLVTIEAMACAKAVVGTQSGGIPEIVVEQETGLLVPPAQPEALADALITLLRDPARRQRMGEKGRQRVLEQFTLQRRTQQIAAALELLASQKPPR